MRRREGIYHAADRRNECEVVVGKQGTPTIMAKSVGTISISSPLPQVNVGISAAHSTRQAPTHANIDSGDGGTIGTSDVNYFAVVQT